jgi:glycine hydroxymethyltransferase
MTDFLFRGSLSDLDPAVYELAQIESERQARKLILIPSESTAPLSVREAFATSFQNLYAEGYPDEESRAFTEPEILDYPSRLAHYRRYADPRYYKGVEYADLIEALARRRCAELFATPTMPAGRIYVNVQPLSGAPANNAVYTALLTPGDTILGMNLLHGGHLSHGSSVNRSGKLFKAVHYAVDPVTQKIDYEAVQALANEHKPKIIIAGYSSYSFVPDWQIFRDIADSVGATLLADISHIAGMVAAGVVPSPVGIAHVITFTTHKTLCGPRGACILTTDAALGRKIDRAVFPGEQGGPHIHAIAAIATAFKLDQTEKFKQLQFQIVRNCKVLNDWLAERGLRIAFGGTDTHLTNVDCKSVVGPDGTPLSGDMAARILDIAGIVLNRNTIPGDKTALNASGIRLGTPWVTQRGLKEAEMIEIADIIADVLFACVPYTIGTRQGLVQRAKVDFTVLETARLRVRALVDKAATDQPVETHGYPHFYHIDDQPLRQSKLSALELSGENVLAFANYAFTANVEALSPGESQPTRLVTPKGAVDGVLTLLDPGNYQFSFEAAHFGLAATWLRDLSDGYVAFDQDVSRRIPGPVVVTESLAAPIEMLAGDPFDQGKPFFIGKTVVPAEPKPVFSWVEPENAELRRTPLNDVHCQMGGKMVPFAGWEMPVQYTGVVEEHLATRKAAGLFDVSHMGVYQVEGPDAPAFLDSVCGNDIAGLAVGESCYTHFLDPQANVIDDTLVYRRSAEQYLVVVNASNDDKDWAWLNGVLKGEVLADPQDPGVRAFGRNAILRNLRDPKEGADMRVDIALQGPKSRDILLSMGCDAATRRRITALKRTELCEAVVGGFKLVVSRTGYTGEKMAFELFVHPDQAVALWNALLAAGEPLGLKACGLGARDSLRTEAGLPLYGHEMGGELNLGVAEAGFGSYVKTYKPWFIGRAAFLAREKYRKGVVARFRFNEKGVRVAHLGDPVLDMKGRVVGSVTSCSIDSEGYLTGQAFVELNTALEGTAVMIYQSASKVAPKAAVELKSGDRVTLPTAATIVSRYPKLGN